MRLHIFNMNILLEHEDRYGHLKFAFGTFDLDTLIEAEFVREMMFWCRDNCSGQCEIFDTYASYTTKGVKDVTVIAFKEEADAMAFKLRWM